jgi:hypothetical protein
MAGGPAPRRPLRRPLRVTLAPSVARLVVAYLDREPEQSAAWLRANCRTDEERLALEEALDELRYVAGWQRAWSLSDVGQTVTPVSDIAGGSSHDEITTAEAALEFDVSPRTVLRWLDDGLLIGRRVSARQTMVTRASVNALRQARSAA